MSDKVLITDSLFIFDEHIEAIKNAGYNPVRLDKVKATEEELIEAIKGCVGYILGGVEHVTENVLNAAPDLKAICFTGTDFRHYVPSYEVATARGIKITNCPGANSGAVSQFALSLILTMLRRVPSLCLEGGTNFIITDEFEDLSIGVIGYGRIGQKVAQMLRSLGFNVMISTRSHQERATSDGFECVSLDKMISEADCISLHVEGVSSENMITANHIKALKNGAVIINTCRDKSIDREAMNKRLEDGSILFAADHHDNTITNKAPIGHVMMAKASSAYNTHRANKLGSDWSTESLLNILSGKDDKRIVN